MNLIYLPIIQTTYRGISTMVYNTAYASEDAAMKAVDDDHHSGKLGSRCDGWMCRYCGAKWDHGIKRYEDDGVSYKLEIRKIIVAPIAADDSRTENVRNTLPSPLTVGEYDVDDASRLPDEE